MAKLYDLVAGRRRIKKALGRKKKVYMAAWHKMHANHQWNTKYHRK